MLCQVWQTSCLWSVLCQVWQTSCLVLSYLCHCASLHSAAPIFPPAIKSITSQIPCNLPLTERITFRKLGFGLCFLKKKSSLNNFKWVSFINSCLLQKMQKIGTGAIGVCQYKDSFPGMGIPMLKIRWSWDHLIFNMGIPIPVRRHLYIETAPGVWTWYTF